MHSFELPQTGTGHPKMGVPDCIAHVTAATFALPNHKLDKVRTLLVRLVLAGFLVHFVNFVVTALEADQPLEAHGGGVEAIRTACGNVRPPGFRRFSFNFRSCSPFR